MTCGKNIVKFLLLVLTASGTTTTQPPPATTQAPITTQAETSPTTATRPTTVNTPTFGTTTAVNSRTTAQTPAGQTDQTTRPTASIPSTTGTQSATNNAGGSAAAAVIVLLVIIGIATGLIILFVCCIKKKHGSFKGWLQSSRNLAMDNLIYRVGSDRIPLRIHKKPSQATINLEPQASIISQPESATPIYSIPRDRQERTLYAIPQNNTPSAHSNQNYSVVRPFSDPMSSLNASSEYNVVPQHNEQAVEVNVTDCDQEIPQNVPTISVPEYNVIPPQIDAAAKYNLVPPHKENNPMPNNDLALPRNAQLTPEGYSLVPPRNGQIVAPGYNLVPPARKDQKAVDQRKRLSEQIYIFMENEEMNGGDNQNQSGQSGNPDDEVYIYLRYGTVEYTQLLSQATENEESDRESPFLSPPSREEEIYVVLSEQHIKVIPRKGVETNEGLGSGHFGNVHKGTWVGSKGTLQVAVKSVNKDASQTDKVRLLQEAAIMGQFKHPNITHLHGIVTQGEPLLLIMEYMPKGDLKRYLTKLRPEPDSLVPETVPILLVSFSQQVALGMHYLASKGFVHRDLAARNIFVAEDDTCKIGDFGMSRDLSEDECYTGRGGKVPIKWTAPEAVHRRKYSIASDVWSYGCLLYEIWSLGRKPFRGIESSKALQMVDGGYRLPPPPGCPFIIYNLMIKSWHPVAAARPKYCDMLTSLLQDERKVLDIPVEDASTHPEACLLGAPMEAGNKMYMGLQHCYNPDASDNHDPDYEYGEAD